MSRTLIHGAAVITMDDQQPDSSAADVLIDGNLIAAIEPAGTIGRELYERELYDVDVVDGRKCIVIPGLVNAHMHTWQTALRGVASNWTLPEYFRKMHAGLATVFRPEDLHIATLVGALNQLNCGTTTLVDWCHNNPTPAHNDAALHALCESGIRAVFFHGTPKPDPKPGQPGFWEIPHPRTELTRLLRQRRSDLVNVGAAILGPHYSTLEVAVHDFKMAKDLGVITSMHQGGGPARTPNGWQQLDEEGLLGPHVNLVHGHGLSDDQLERFCSLGMSFSVTAENEMIQGHGIPITGRLRALGRNPSLGVDLESTVSGEMLTAARIALNLQRAMDNVKSRETTGTIPTTSTISTREALSWITIEGARMLQMESQIGSLRPGKQADLVMISTDALNMQPVHDLVSTALIQTSLVNIDSVMVAGRWRKRAGRLLEPGLSEKIDRLRMSGERIISAMNLD